MTRCNTSSRAAETNANQTIMHHNHHYHHRHFSYVSRRFTSRQLLTMNTHSEVFFHAVVIIIVVVLLLSPTY